MLYELMKQTKMAVLVLLLLTFLTGVLYPLLVTGIAQLFYPSLANGSLIERDGKIIGSHLIGQSFTEPRYFWGRPSATSPNPYNAASSSGSNLGPSNPSLLDAVKQRVAMFRRSDSPAVPVDLVTSSASGLDPDISPLAAFYQVPRIAKERHLSEAEIIAMVEKHISHRLLGVLGEPTVNVLDLNLALDNAKNH